LQKAALALITNISATQGVQVVGGMVSIPSACGEDGPAPTHGTKGGNNNNTPMSPDTIDEDDPFAGLDDLEDSKSNKPSRAGGDGGGRREARRRRRVGG
jgi:hypothetical protein